MTVETLSSVPSIEIDSNVPRNWASLMFQLPTDRNEAGRACSLKSNFFCLQGYRTMGDRSAHEESDYESDYLSDLPTEELANEFSSTIDMWWTSINMFSDKDNEECCEDQTNKYLLYGLIYRNMSPTVYFSHLTNFWDTGKQLNYIGADYDANRCVNIITELGFGEPPLVVHAFQTLAHPFVFPALPGGVASFPVTNTNPSSALTYTWFKHNVICRGQPWICR
ncbi:uncharacterized protein LOC134853447 [Symsagittifera roscoffensis]|uniref:uncharacterized protein LOC134853447 n=1 Tax=Symsagittifera roscoffensis TaxID=84072 RepID=UPI00307BD02D